MIITRVCRGVKKKVLHDIVFRTFSSSCINKKSTASYDYVIIGSGSAGCVLANRLSENGKYTVVAMEAGPRDRWWDWRIHMPVALGYNLLTDNYNWHYHTTPQKYLNNRQILWPRGRVWGGSSALNAMVYVRGHAKDYDRWATEEGADGWSYKNCLPYFKKSQTHSLGGNKYRGSDGPLNVSRGVTESILYEVFIEAGLQAGHKFNDDFNGEDQEGVGPFDLTIHNGKRWSTSQAYLRPVLHRENLTTINTAICTRVLFQDTKAIGVEYLQGGEIKRVEARKEVILAGGAVNSPQLLMLSGIGDEEELAKHDIKIRSHLPGVGKNLQDHLCVCIFSKCIQPVSMYKYTHLWKAPLIGARWCVFKDGICSSNTWEAGAFLHTDDGITHPDVQLHFSPIASNDYGKSFPYGDSYVTHVSTMRETSHGTIKLQSNNPRDHPLINPNYLATEQDRTDMRNGVKMAREILSQDAFTEYRGEEILPGESLRSNEQLDEQLDEFIRQHSDTNYHASCTCKMGSDDDPFAVVDSRTRVKGFEQFRIVDASIMPSIVSGNLNGPVIMMAEKSADMIKEDNK